MAQVREEGRPDRLPRLTDNIDNEGEELFAREVARVVEICAISSSHGHVLTNDLQCLASHGLKLVVTPKALSEHPLQEGEAVHEAWRTVILLFILISP